MGSGGIVSDNRDIMVWSCGKLRSRTISRASLLPCIAFAKTSLFRSMGISFATSSMPDKLLMLLEVLVILRLSGLMVFYYASLGNNGRQPALPCVPIKWNTLGATAIYASGIVGIP